MLLQLDIKNYAIIDELQVSFSDNLNVITGETGAGKSILLGALSLILGMRADPSTLRDKKRKAVIEGMFQLPDAKNIQQFFPDNNLDYASVTIIRREIIPSGKSRSFINDTPVKLQQLSAFSALLVNLHQQFDTLQLGQTDFQFHVLDLLAGNKPALQEYKQHYKNYIDSRQEWEQLQNEAQQSSRESDYDRFLLNELSEAEFSDNELEELNQELQAMTHTEDLKRGLSATEDLLELSESAILQQLRSVQNQLEPLAAFHKKIPDLLERVHSVHVELQDITDEMQQINESVEYDEERISFIQDRINTGYRLLKKHNVQTTTELLELQESLSKKIDKVENLDDTLAAAGRKCAEQEKHLQKEAGQLSAFRQKQIAPFLKELHQLLKRVGMPNARMHIRLEKGSLKESGQDDISFEFDANKSGTFLPLRKVASGGELSRLMLCIKSRIGHTGAMPTLIFDEIESGISGEAARQVSLILKELAATHQVICISHQPQIAGQADTHFQVFKSEKEGRIITGIHKLSPDERIHIIAGMLSGDKPTTAALENAKELLER